MEHNRITHLHPQDEIEQLKAELAEAKRQQEVLQAQQEFEGAMQMADTQQVLKTKWRYNTLLELVMGRLVMMLTSRPVIGNIVGLGIALFAYVTLSTELTLRHAGQFAHYLGIGILIFGGLQIIKSSTRSLLLPLAATLVGVIVTNTLHHGQTLFHFHSTFYQYVMAVGLIGLALAVFHID